ncbi:MAG: hypothetical protein G01um101413_5 [Parcubacteria group bacterium Gr01-1014_13]|nr:MAG: hypothetical protein G01um101413_5 [Parcubacteria group bacterium Gr01-1014_13]
MFFGFQRGAGFRRQNNVTGGKMTIDTFKTVRAYLFYSGTPSVLETPSVQDVLFALGLSKTQENKGDQIYVDNVNLVIATIGFEVSAMKPYDEVLARKMIAKAIIDLCPYGGRCLLNGGYVDARIAAGEKAWEVTKRYGTEALEAACICPRHLFEFSKGQKKTAPSVVSK